MWNPGLWLSILVSLALAGCETTQSFNPGKPAAENLVAPSVRIPVLVIDRGREFRTEDKDIKEAIGDAVFGAIFNAATGGALKKRADKVNSNIRGRALKRSLSGGKRSIWQNGFEPVVVETLFEKDPIPWTLHTPPSEMNKNRIAGLAKSFDADLVVVTEYLSCGCTASYYDGTCTATCDIEIMFRLYDGGAGTILDEHVVFDRVVEKENYHNDEELEKEERKEREKDCYDQQGVAASSAIRAATSKYALRLEPFFEEAAEHYYSDIEGLDFQLMRDAMDMAERGDWEGAEAIWEAAVEAAVIPSTKADLLYNLAVAAERRGDRASARALAERSNLLSVNPIVEDYLAWLSRK